MVPHTPGFGKQISFTFSAAYLLTCFCGVRFSALHTPAGFSNCASRENNLECITAWKEALALISALAQILLHQHTYSIHILKLPLLIITCGKLIINRRFHRILSINFVSLHNNLDDGPKNNFFVSSVLNIQLLLIYNKWTLFSHPAIERVFLWYLFHTEDYTLLWS